MNPYTHQLFLFVPNAGRGALGQFMRDFGSTLEQFVWDEDAEMQAVSDDGQGPPGGWTFASWVTEAQADAFVNHPDLPSTIVVDGHPGREDYDAWLASLTPPMQRILDD